MNKKDAVQKSVFLILSLFLTVGCSTPDQATSNNSTSHNQEGKNSQSKTALAQPNLQTQPTPQNPKNPHETIRGAVEAHLFTIDRGLKEYQDYFGKEFHNDLKKLKPHQHWIDGGSGNAYAQKDFLGSRDGKKILSNKPKMTAITFKYPQDQPLTLNKSRFKVMVGRYFEDIPNQEIETADLITDVVGIINYTDQIDVVLDKYLQILKDNGVIYVFIPSGITFIYKGDRRLNLTQWLQTIPGLEVRGLEPDKSPYPKNFSFIIRKAASGIVVPRLKLIAASHKNIVMREFREE